MPAESYVLLVATGRTPQVVTETIFALARQDSSPKHPAEVCLLTTRVGEAFARALLLGEPVTDPVRGMVIPDAQDRWTAFCRDVLQAEPLPITIHVPSDHGRAVEDILEPGDDLAFANACYRFVAERTRPGDPPLVGSIAGGRKTMGAHLMTAFSVYARPGDRLTHVLVSPPAFERQPDFFYPTPEVADRVRVDLVDVRFPRLHAVLRNDLFADLPSDRRDLQGILNALEPYAVLHATPDTITLHLRSGEATLCLESQGETLGTCRLTPNEAATLLVLAEKNQVQSTRSSSNIPDPAEARSESSAPFSKRSNVAVEDLYHESTMGPASFPGAHPVHQQRCAVMMACERFPEVAPWTNNDDVSKAVSRLNRRLRRSPIIAKYVGIKRVRIGGGASGYVFDEPFPAPLRLRAAGPVDHWPFTHLPQPVRSARVTEPSDRSTDGAERM